MSLKKDILTSAIAILTLTLLLGVLYPLFITGVSQVTFPGNANGQQVHVGGRLVASKIIGQSFADPVINPSTGKPKLDSNGGAGGIETTPDPRYFQTRPSATVPPDNAAASSFSNLGPNGVNTKEAIQANIRAYLALEKPYNPGLTVAKIPVDAANTSASGIDPDISVANADIQAHRVAAVRHLPLSTVNRLISTYTAGRGLGFSGEPAVNVVELNLALNRLGGR
jgi:potassium-transporting ATPase KdpC subunit